MVIWVAVGGRGTLFGAVLGALVVNAAQTRGQRVVSRRVAVRHRRAVHRDRAAVPARAGRWHAVVWQRVRPAEATGAVAARVAGGVEVRSAYDRAAAGCERRQHQFRRHSGARRPQPELDAGRAAVSDRAQRRRQDDADRRHQRQDAPTTSGSVHVRRPRRAAPAAAPAGAPRDGPQVSDAGDLHQSERARESRELPAALRTAAGGCCRRSAPRSRTASTRCCELTQLDGARATPARACCRTASSSGWRSACC